MPKRTNKKCIDLDLDEPPKIVETMETSGDGDGNTDSSPKAKVHSRDNQYKYWCFTWNNYDMETMETMETILRGECKWYIFQEETGEKEETPHLQGIIYLKEKQRLNQLKVWCKQIHWEPTKSVKASIAYCLKEETRTGRQWSYGIDIPQDIKVHEPRGWALDVMEILRNEPDERTIHWFWEPDGNVGKTCLCKYLVHRKDALMLSGKSADMYHMLSKYPDKRKIILVDAPRCAIEFLNYGAIEQIKNGLIFSGKYEGSQLVFNCPHVVVFANTPPDYDKMSADRWNVNRIVA